MAAPLLPLRLVGREPPIKATQEDSRLKYLLNILVAAEEGQARSDKITSLESLEEQEAMVSPLPSQAHPQHTQAEAAQLSAEPEELEAADQVEAVEVQVKPQVEPTQAEEAEEVTEAASQQREDLDL